MSGMLDTVIPKSDQLNADDLIAGQTKTIKITDIKIAMGEQPVSIHYEGDNGKPYKPGKSMRRVMIGVWGADANAYIGRSMTLYRDERVKFGGAEVGGIRISHMSDIAEPITLALTAAKASRKPFTVAPLKIAQDPALEVLKRNARAAAILGTGQLEAWWKLLPKDSQTKMKPHMEEFKTLASQQNVPIVSE